MSRNSNIGHGNASANQEPSPVVVAAALAKITHPQSDAFEIVDLTQLIEERVEAHRHHALERNIRVTCCCLDDLGVLGSEREIATRLDTILAGAIDAAISGTRIECNATVERGSVVVRLRFLRPATRPTNGDLEMVGGEILACWPLVEDC